MENTSKWLIVVLFVTFNAKSNGEIGNNINVTISCEDSNSCIPKEPIVEGTIFKVSLLLSNVSDFNGNETFHWRVTSENEKIMKVESIKFQKNDTKNVNAIIALFANSLGRTHVVVTVSSELEGSQKLVNQKIFDVAVKRAHSSLQLYFSIVVAVLVGINNINMGCFLQLDVIKKSIKIPTAPIIGFLSQFLFMPIASLLFGKLFFPHNTAWRLGLFVLGCSPGGTGSNFWTLLLGGDVDLSVTMTLFSSIAALGMMPLWLFLLAKEVVGNTSITIPYLNMIASLLALTLPLVIGLWIQKHKPSIAAISRKYLRLMTIILLIIVITGGISINFFIIQNMQWSMLFAGVCVAWGGYAFGAIFAAMFKLPSNQVIAVSIETALQNPGIAFVLLQTSLEQPDADLAAIPVVVQLLVTGPPLWLVYLAVVLLKKAPCCADTNEKVKTIEEEGEHEADKFIESST